MTSSESAASIPVAVADNPLLQTWDTPFGLPPFDAIKPEHFLPAIDHEMERRIGRLSRHCRQCRRTGFREHDCGDGAG
jgi:peptidyl-dipeptidase Dcp